MSHANRGLGWQAELDRWHDQYRRDQRAVVTRTHPPIVLLSRIGARGQFRACFEGKAPPDYIGRVAGVAVCFDAKESATSTWSFGLLEDHQARDLEAWSLDPSAVAALAIRFGSGECWWVDWRELGPRWWAWRELERRAKPGEASLVEGELGRRMPTPGDWLAVFA